MTQLTKKQEAVYNFICNYLQINHNMPTYRDISIYFDVYIKSAWDYVIILINKGFLKKVNGKLKLTQFKINLEKYNENKKNNRKK